MRLGNDWYEIEKNGRKFATNGAGIRWLCNRQPIDPKVKTQCNYGPWQCPCAFLCQSSHARKHQASIQVSYCEEYLMPVGQQSLFDQQTHRRVWRDIRTGTLYDAPYWERLPFVDTICKQMALAILENEKHSDASPAPLKWRIRPLAKQGARKWAKEMIAKFGDKYSACTFTADLNV